MASVSQRRDLDDPAVIRNFARKIETPEALNLLTLLTFADSQGTSDKLWNGFKDALLWQLHSARNGAAHRRHGIRPRRGKNSANRCCRKSGNWPPRSLSDEEINTHFATLPARYFQIHTAKEIIDDLELAHRFMHRLILEDDRVLSPMIAWRDEADRGYNVVKICTWDRAGLFSKIAGSFSAAGLNILSAQIFTRADGIVLDTFFVNDGRTGNLATRAAARQIRRAAGKSPDRTRPLTCPRSSRARSPSSRFTRPTPASGCRRRFTLTTRCPRRARSSKLRPRIISACFT